MTSRWAWLARCGYPVLAALVLTLGAGPGRRCAAETADRYEAELLGEEPGAGEGGEAAARAESVGPEDGGGPPPDEPGPAAAATGIVAIAAPAPPPGGVVGGRQLRAVRVSLAGKWTARVGKQDVDLLIGDDGRFDLDGVAGVFDVTGAVLRLQTDEGAIGYQFDLTPADLLTPAVLTLSGGDLAQPLKFTCQSMPRRPAEYLRDLFELSPQSVRARLHRIVVVLAIVILSRMLIAVLRALSRFVIYSEWGPLRFLYRAHKNRATTIHSLVLNLIKYVVYFGALGRILTELGVNYAAYIASLSVVGLAIGFGSQGLVQDIVTGFFIIFENQFDVGDMVEISGQTGVVEELGVRMTKLRNYFGQMVIIPNRNIATVGTYRKGAMEVTVDVTVPGAESAPAALRVLEALGKEIVRQFEGVILSPPAPSGPLQLKTGETVVRLSTAIWPQQQWVVDQQLLPRLRNLLKAQEVPVPDDGIVAFYHARRLAPVPGVSALWTKLRKPAAPPAKPEKGT